MLIRRCNLADPAELLAAHTLQRAAYEIEAALIGTREIPGLTETIAQLAASAEVFDGCFVNEPGIPSPLLVGLVATEPEDNRNREGTRAPELRISRLAVSPSFSRRGVGRSLVRMVIQEVARPQRCRVNVSTGSANAAARALYESEGFRFVHERTVGRAQPVRIVEYQWG